MKRIAVFLIALFFPAWVGAATVYIDPTCGSSGDGTRTTCGTNGPFKTWAEVTWTSGNTYAQKGGTVAYAPDTYVMISVGADNVTLTSYGTGNAILDGGVTINPATGGDPNWTANDPVSGVYSHPTDRGDNYVKMEDSIFLAEASNTSCTDGNTARRYIVGGTRYYYKPTSGTIADHTFQEITYEGIGLAGHNYVTISNLTLRKFRTAIAGYQVTPTETGLTSSHVNITGCTITNCEFGIGFYFVNTDATNNTVTQSTFDYVMASVEFYNYGTAYHSSDTVSSNTMSHCAQVYTPTGPATYDWSAVDLAHASGEDLEGIGSQDIHDSAFHHNAITGACRGYYMFTVNNKSSYNNNFYDNFIKTTRNPLILNPDTSSSPGAVGQYNNSFYYNIFAGGSADGTNTVLYLNNTVSPSSTYNTIYNNVIYASGEAQAVTFLQYGDYFILKNNIIYGASNYPIFESYAQSHITYDYNLYNTYANGFRRAGNSYTYTQWQALGASYDQHSPALGDPSFTNGGGSYSLATDFQLQSSSPAINAGVNVGLTTDYAGNPIVGNPDIGAYEYQPVIAPALSGVVQKGVQFSR